MLVDLEVFYLGNLKNFYTIQYNTIQLCQSPHPTMKPAEGGEGEMLVTAAVLQVSAAGCRESTAALPAAVGLPLVPNLAVTH